MKSIWSRFATFIISGRGGQQVTARNSGPTSLPEWKAYARTETAIYEGRPAGFDVRGSSLFLRWQFNIPDGELMVTGWVESPFGVERSSNVDHDVVHGNVVLFEQEIVVGAKS